MLSTGDVVSAPRGPINHVGIFTDVGTVISNSGRRGCVVEETLDEFAAGSLIRRVGYLGRLAPHVVVARARSQLGRRYNLFASNCEHLVHYAHGLPRRSPQLVAASVVAGALLLSQIGRQP